MSAWLLVALLSTLGSKDAPPCVVSLTTESADVHGLDLALVRASVREESGCDVQQELGPDASRLVLRVKDATHAHLSLTHADGRHLERDVVLDPDLTERVRALAIVAAHMLRNEADELLASLTARRRADAAEVEDEPEPTVETAVDAPPAAAPSPPVVRLALGALVSSVPTRSGLDATFVGGLEVAGIVAPWLVIGVRDLSGSGLPGPPGSWGVGGAPFVELAWRFDATWSLHGQLGVDLRVLGSQDPVRAGVSPFVIVGGRVQILRELSIALQSGLHVVASDGWSTALHLVPQGAIPWSGGLSVAVHL